MLVLVGALVAFDRWPNQAVAEAETVPIAGHGPAAIREAAAPARRLAAADAAAASADASSTRENLSGAAARAGRVESRTAAPQTPQSSAQPDDAVVSALPAPDTAPDQRPSAPAPAAPASDPAAQSSGPTSPITPIIALPPGAIAPNAGGNVTEATGQLGERLDYVSPSLGQTVRGTGSTVDATLQHVLGGR
jgi:hypothetical protein